VVDRLRVVGLQLQRHDREAVGGEHNVEGLVGRGVEADLAKDAQAHGSSGLDDLGEVGVRRRERHHRPELRSGPTDLCVGGALAEHAEQPADRMSRGRVHSRGLGELLGDVLEQLALGLRLLPVDQVAGNGLLVLVRVLGAEPVQHVAGNHRETDVPPRRPAVALVQPAALCELGAEVALELQLHQLRVAHATSFRPVTTSVMSAMRRLSSSVFSR
jgi:hypothetical protein